MRAGLVQLSVGDLPADNVAPVRALVRAAVEGGADLVLTPEVTNCISMDRAHQARVLGTEDSDPVLAMLRDEAARAGVWVLAGSILVKTGDPEDARFANRSLLIDPQGQIAARYDKIHLFDVQVTETETFRESAGIRPGAAACLAPTPFGPVGMTVCYDLRFAHLYRALAQAGARILTVPAAFSPVTGVAHWEVLLRARAIETGCFVLAPAQTGTHPSTTGRIRKTWGHSLAIDPWGQVLADAGTEPGLTLVDLDLSAVDQARGRVPSLNHDRAFAPPVPVT